MILDKMAKMATLKNGIIHIKGYPGEIINRTIEKQFLDKELWKITANQFRTKRDSSDNGWRGEFWGKLMRSASLTYMTTKNRELYNVITDSVKDMLTTIENSGRFSTYTADNEFIGWDLWSRKYVMLGFIYYIEICKNKSLIKKVITALKKHADYIIKHIGENKLSILDTSNNYGGMNSCSILEPFVKLYEITNEKRYIEFSEYIINTGFLKGQNIIDICKFKKKYPFEFNQTKAYEMMSCFEGLLEYYKVMGNPDHLKAVINFVDMIIETDYTVIGGSGCTHELFDNSGLRQTERIDGVMQETCVTVTLIKLCAKLFAITSNVKYIDIIERSSFNALFGAVNTENQTMERAKGIVWEGYNEILVPHEAFLFDSYSPLYYNRRATKIGGFKVMENDRSCGCCASIGGTGTALFGLISVMLSNGGYFVNLYNDCLIKNSSDIIKVKSNLYKKGYAKISVITDRQIQLYLRIPYWAESFKLYKNDEEVEYINENGYAPLSAKNGDVIVISMPIKVKKKFINEKVEFERGPIVLARDQRFNEDIQEPISISKSQRNVSSCVIKNDSFYTNITMKIKLKNEYITVCDYSSAGKNFDGENCYVSVWNSIQ